MLFILVVLYCLQGIKLSFMLASSPPASTHVIDSSHANYALTSPFNGNENDICKICSKLIVILSRNGYAPSNSGVCRACKLSQLESSGDLGANDEEATRMHDNLGGGQPSFVKALQHDGILNETVKLLFMDDETAFHKYLSDNPLHDGLKFYTHKLPPKVATAEMISECHETTAANAESLTEREFSNKMCDWSASICTPTNKPHENII